MISVAPRHQKLCGQQVDGFPVLIEHRASHGDDALMRLGARRRDFNNFTLDAQNVAGTCGPGPSDISAQANDAVCKWEAPRNEEPHGHRRRVPTARRQSFEDAWMGRAFVTME